MALITNQKPLLSLIAICLTCGVRSLDCETGNTMRHNPSLWLDKQTFTKLLIGHPSSSHHPGVCCGPGKIAVDSDTGPGGSLVTRLAFLMNYHRTSTHGDGETSSDYEKIGFHYFNWNNGHPLDINLSAAVLSCGMNMTSLATGIFSFPPKKSFETATIWYFPAGGYSSNAKWRIKNLHLIFTLKSFASQAIFHWDYQNRNIIFDHFQENIKCKSSHKISSKVENVQKGQ